MPVTYPYLEIDKQFYPIIDLTLCKKSVFLSVRALVDSGATYSLFNLKIAQHFGINIVSGKQLFLAGIGGRILGYQHNIPAIVNGKQFELKTIFSEEFNISMNILGRNNFFENFLITFDEKRRLITLDY